jgi:rubredoxin
MYNQYVCLECGWIYDEKVGDPARGYPAGTLWDDLPDDFTCGDCEVRKSDIHMWQKIG